jgi:GNAT superfamily N-acetyltransferase
MPVIRIRPLEEKDRAWVAGLLEEHWRSARIVTRGRVHQADRLPGFIAEVEGRPVGLLTYEIDARQCEVVSLNSMREGIGVGAALLGAAREVARDAGCRRVWLITTNDNLAALRFHQKRGFRLVAVHCNALEESRRLKPEIPLVGNEDIPIRDEIELEVLL